PNGRISAIDLAPEHVDAVQARIDANQYSCPVAARVADIANLPFEDGTFDAVWNANVFQYLSEAEILATLAEFGRVLKPGGTLAIKDGDITALQIFPIPAPRLWRLLDAWAVRGERQALGMLESLKLPRFLEMSGFVHVERDVVFIERAAPLRHADIQFIGGLFAVFWPLSPPFGLSTSPVGFLHNEKGDPTSSYILNKRDLYFLAPPTP